MSDYPECEQFTGRKRQICRGEAGKALADQWRVKKWNLPEWRPSAVHAKSRGLGDTIAKITHATGIDIMVDYVSEKVTGKKGGCGCKARQEKLNQIVPYGGQE